MAGTIYIQLMGFGAEVSVVEIDEPTYKFWKENEEKYEEGESEYNLDDYVWSSDRGELINSAEHAQDNPILEDAQFLDEWTEWYEPDGQIYHHTGVDYATGVMRITHYPDIKPEDFESHSLVFDSPKNEVVLTRDDDGNDYIEIQDFEIRGDETIIKDTLKKSHLIEMTSSEKGIFGGYAIPDTDFDKNKIEFSCLTLPDGSALVENLLYDDDIVDELGDFETRGKGSWINLWKKEG
tara:strand:+ start:538 stop:1248 length:711 start_codon:yes stop_codon:yes gene_type:complete